MKTKLTALLIASIMLISPIVINPTISHADTKPKVTQSIKTPTKAELKKIADKKLAEEKKAKDKKIVELQLTVVYNSLDLTSMFYDKLLDLYLYGEIGEGTYLQSKDCLDNMDNSLYSAISILKKGTPIPNDMFTQMNDNMTQIIAYFGGDEE